MQPADLDLVGAWLQEPHVARWYLAGSTVEQELDELRGSVAGADATRALVALDRNGQPIGWCQWYRCRDYPDHAADVKAGPDDFGIDYAIGDPARTGRGLGIELVAALVRHVRREHPAAGLVAVPEAANAASRSVLEKNGFRLIAEGRLVSERSGARMAIYRLPSCCTDQRA